MVKVSASILAADFANLERDIRKVEEVTDFLHIDVMDGHFVPNITIGVPVVQAIHKITSLKLDVHLMITNPELYLEAFIQAGADLLTVHYETCPHLHAILSQIKRLGAQAFVSINPHTPVSFLQYCLSDVDGVLLMTVNPGFGGQKFIQRSFQKVRELQEIRVKESYRFLISVDGGVNESNYRELVDCGVDILVAGSSIFGAKNPKEVILRFKGLSQE